MNGRALYKLLVSRVWARSLFGTKFNLRVRVPVSNFQTPRPRFFPWWNIDGTVWKRNPNSGEKDTVWITFDRDIGWIDSVDGTYSEQLTSEQGSLWFYSNVWDKENFEPLYKAMDNSFFCVNYSPCGKFLFLDWAVPSSKARAFCSKMKKFLRENPTYQVVR